jgi:hypothetical protein
MDWSTHSFFQGNKLDCVDGMLDMSTIRDQSQDLLNNWEKHYPASNFKPCKEFQGVYANQPANQQIQKSQLQRVPLIKKLVKTFERDVLDVCRV